MNNTLPNQSLDTIALRIWAEDHGLTETVEGLLNNGTLPSRLTDILLWAAEHAPDVFIFGLLPHQNEYSSLATAGLEWSAENGHNQIVLALLDNGAQPCQSPYALKKATENGHTKIVQILLKNGAQPNMSPDALTIAAKNGNAEIVQALLDNGAQLNESPGALTIAAENGNAEIVQALLATQPSQSLMSDALTKAAEYGHIEIVQTLLKGGAKPGHFTLEYAASNGYTNIVLNLLASGAGYREFGYALTAAVRNGNTKTVQVLLNNSVNRRGLNLDVNLRDAAEHGHTEIAQALMNNGVKVYSGALGDALENGHIETYKVLTNHIPSPRNAPPLQQLVRASIRCRLVNNLDNGGQPKKQAIDTLQLPFGVGAYLYLPII